MYYIELIIFLLLLFAGVFVFVLDQQRKTDFLHAATAVDHELFKIESPIEMKLYNALKVRGYDVKTQIIVPPRKYRIDLVLYKDNQKIAIECDGKAYHSSQAQKARDKRKDNYLRSKGFLVYRFSGSQINGNLKEVIKRIEKAPL